VLVKVSEESVIMKTNYTSQLSWTEYAN